MKRHYPRPDQAKHARLANAFGSTRHPTFSRGAMKPSLDPVIHQRVRLAIVGMLNPAEKVHFKMIRDELGLSDSSLSQHLSTLDDAGYVHIEEAPDGTQDRHLGLAHASRTQSARGVRRHARPRPERRSETRPLTPW
jgi:DNA-binding transcriptional ArsR family regulator